jgi:cysteine-rich repeat protein
VVITTSADIPFGPSPDRITIAVVEVQADVPVQNPADGMFFLRAECGNQMCMDIPGLGSPAGGQGSTDFLFPAVCGDGVLSPAVGETCDGPFPDQPRLGPDDTCVQDTCLDDSCDTLLNICTISAAPCPGGTDAECPDFCNLQGTGVTCTVDADCGGVCSQPVQLTNTIVSCTPLNDIECQVQNFCRTDTDPDAPCTYCGDGVTDTAAGEACDDGNAIDDDGCNNQCQVCADIGIGDFIWEDEDKNGIQGATEAGIGGVDINVWRCDGSNTPTEVVATVRTGELAPNTGIYGATVRICGPSDNLAIEVLESNFDPGGALDGFTETSSFQGSNEEFDSNCTNRISDCRIINQGNTDNSVDCGYFQQDEVCMVIIDEEGVDNDFRTVETAASYCGTQPDLLVNDQGTPSSSDLPSDSMCSSRNLDSSNSLPVECGNPPLLWNKRAGPDCGDADGPGNLALMPTGEVDDEGWHAPPPPYENSSGYRVIRYADDRPSYCDRYSIGQSESIIEPPAIKDGYDLFIEEFAAGLIRQDCLDKVRDVMPLRSQDLIALVGRTCVGIVYDSDISTNYRPLYANLQGRRSGAFSFTVEAYEVPGSLPESGSSTSLVDLWLRIEEPLIPTEGYIVEIRDHEPDSIAITKATAGSGGLMVYATSDFAPDAHMTVSVDGPDYGTDPNVDPYVVEGVMTWDKDDKRYEFTMTNGWDSNDLVGRRLVISTDEGGSYNDKIRAGEYQSRYDLLRELRRRFYQRLRRSFGW